MRHDLKAAITITALLTVPTAPLLAADTEGLSKLGAGLQFVAKAAEERARIAHDELGANFDQSRLGRTGPNREIELVKVSSDGFVIIDAVASGETDDLVVTIQSLGGENVSSYGRLVSARVPVDRLVDLASSNFLTSASSVHAITNRRPREERGARIRELRDREPPKPNGLVVSQGDRSMRTDITREKYGLYGEGLSIGILSDSYACDPGGRGDLFSYTTPDEDLLNGDITHRPVILSDYLEDDCIDEGRAMAQLIQDVLPEANIIFHSAANGKADLAQGIIELAQVGADVIVDDVIYLEEPMFQDGIVAQAANQVAAWGIPYISAAGNWGNQSFESEYRPVKATIGNLTGTWHDFDRDGRAVDTLASYTLPSTGSSSENPAISISFQWDSPNFSVSGGAGSQNELDLMIFDAAGKILPNCHDINDEWLEPANGKCILREETKGDAIEVVKVYYLSGDREIEIGFLTKVGDAPNFVKFVTVRAGLKNGEYPLNASTVFGHSNAMGAESIAAAAFYATEEFIWDPYTFPLQNGNECVPACLSQYSSLGGTGILFDIEGNRLSEPEIRLKPGVTGPDGANTTFIGFDSKFDDDNHDGRYKSDEELEFPNFFGTSAAAPHMAAMIGQLVNWEGSHGGVSRGPRGAPTLRVCKLDTGSSSRTNGETVTLDHDQVVIGLEAEELLLRPCNATEPADLYRLVRETAQDMNIRIDQFDFDGDTITVFDETRRDGFDHWSGFGFVDAEAALERFMDPRHRLDRQ